MQAINLAMEVHNAQLEVVSLRDMERARDLVVSVIKNKKANVINEQS